MASLADVVKRRKREGSGRAGAFFGAAGEKTLEAIDPRRLFDQSGVLTALFPSLKAYQAKGTSDKSMDKLATLQASGDAATKVSLETMIVKLDSIDSFSRVTAKNSLILPSMARDTYLIKQNIIKMTKALGEKPQESAGDWFNRQMARETAFEEKFGKKQPSGTQPVQQAKEDNTGIFTSLIGALVSPFKTLSTILEKGFTGILEALSLKKLFDSLGLLRLFGILTSGPMLAMLATIGGASYLIMKLFEPGGLLDKWFKESSLAPKPLADRTDLEKIDYEKGNENFKKRWIDRFERGDVVSPEMAQKIKEVHGIEVPAANIQKPGTSPAPAPTPAPQSTAPTQEGFDMFKYRELVGQSESGGRYDNDNKVGFLGKYQFGAQALETYGYLKKGTSNDKMAVYDPKNWTGKDGIKSAEDFRANRQVQDNLFSAYTAQNYAQLLSKNIIKAGMGAEEIASRLYAAHHGGVGGASKYFEKGQDTKDFAFPNSSVGTSAEKMKVAYAGGAASTSGPTLAAASSSVSESKLALATPQTQPIAIPTNSSPSPQAQPTTIQTQPTAWDPFMLENIVLNKI